MMNWKQILVPFAASAVLAACSDGTAPADQQFDPVTTSQDVKAVEDAFNSDVYNSLDAMGGNFIIPGAVLGTGAVRIAHEAIGPESGYRRIAEITQQMAASLSGPQVILIPDQYRGLTLVFDTATADYIVDGTRTDGPANGVRFILYAVDPVTKEVATPLNEIGYADLLDESTELAGVLRIVVVSGTTEFINYTTSLSGTVLTPMVNINGFVTDGSTRVNVDLTNSAAINVGGVTLTLDYTLTVPASNFEIKAELIITGTGQDETVGFDAQFTQGSHNVRLAGEIINNTGNIIVTVDTDLFATISLAGDSITVTGPDGQPLTAEQGRALEDIMDGFENVFDSFDTFFEPVSFFFGGPDGF